MKIVFFGSDDFAAVHLEALLKTVHQIVACVTQPDKAKGRGMKVVFSPIKEIAGAHKIPLLQPESLKDSKVIAELKAFGADVFVVIAYGKILPQEVLDIPKKMPINVHGSLLPKYRGAAPINWAIMNGETETGVSIIKMNVKMDAGEILADQKVSILDTDDAALLRQKMAQAGKDLLLKTIINIEKNAVVLQKQDESKVTLAPKLNKEMGKIDWKQDPQKIHNLIRGLQPWPGAYTFYKGKQLKILSSQLKLAAVHGKPGEILETGKEGIAVKALNGILQIKEVQLEGSKRMTAKEFLIGHPVPAGTILE